MQAQLTRGTGDIHSHAAVQKVGHERQHVTCFGVPAFATLQPEFVTTTVVATQTAQVIRNRDSVTLTLVKLKGMRRRIYSTVIARRICTV
mmetsp:Transcript_101582/g.199263  ORF Transcript_101582/g.199263 Transcript_101582/m.199263 type:complete len:90 (+) Transcript_101582:130-399(+)